MNEKIISLIIFFKEYKGGKNSLRIKSRKGLTYINNDGTSFINGKWEKSVLEKYLPKILKKQKVRL